VEVLDDLENLDVHHHQFLQRHRESFELLVIFLKYIGQGSQDSRPLVFGHRILSQLILVLECRAWFQKGRGDGYQVDEERHDYDQRTEDQSNDSLLQVLVLEVLSLSCCRDIDHIDQALEKQYWDGRDY